MIQAYVKRDVMGLWKLTSDGYRKTFANTRGNPKRYFPGCIKKELGLTADVFAALSLRQRFKLIKQVSLPPAGWFVLYSKLRIEVANPTTRKVDFSIDVPGNVNMGECELRLVKQGGAWRADTEVLCHWEQYGPSTRGPVGRMSRSLSRVRSVRLWQVAKVKPGSPAHGVLRAGDVIMTAFGTSVAVHFTPSLITVVRQAGNKPIPLTISRNFSTPMNVTVKPRNGKLGVTVRMVYYCR